MTPAEAVEMALNALSDLPSGPDPKQILAIIQAQAWDEGYETCSRDEEDSYWGPSAVTRPNPYRSQE